MFASVAHAGTRPKRHDNVKRTIETLLERGVIASPQIEEKPMSC
jgi:phage regulator Rha-like protein